MTKKNTAKKSFVLSLLALLLCIAMLTTTTFAWFTDSVTSGRNQIVAGNLDIELEVETDDGPVNVTELEEKGLKLFDVDLWEPGVVAYEKFTVKNEGSLALKYALTLTTSNANSVLDKDENDTGKTLEDVIQVAVVPADEFEATRADALALEYGLITPASLYKEGQLLPKGVEDNKGIEAFKADKEDFVVVLYWEPTDHDNDYNVNNGKKVSDHETLNGFEVLHIDFNVTLSATQVPYEEDSFSDDYDEDALMPETQNIVAAINQGAKDSNAAIVEAIKKIAEEKGEEAPENIEKLVYFDEEGLQLNDEGEFAITLHFEPGTIDYVDVTYTAVKTLIGKAVNEQASNIKSIQIESEPVHDLNGQPIPDGETGDWVEVDLKSIVKKLNATVGGGLSGALEAAKANGLKVDITDMTGNTQTFRMNFDLRWNEEP